MSRLADHPWIARGRETVERWRPTPLGQLAVALHDIQLRDRALTLAGQAFISLIPLLIVVATLASSSDGTAVAHWLISRFDLSGDAASSVQSLFERPPEATGGASIVSVIILLISVNSFGRALQRTYEAAWRLPRRGPKRALRGALGTLLLLLVVAAIVATNSTVANWPGGRLLAVPAQLAVSIPGWWLLTRMLLNLRVGWRATFPGAVVSALAIVLSSWAGSVWVPILIERDAVRYGTVGVAVALITWLVVQAFIIVAAAVAGAWAARLVAEAIDGLDIPDAAPDSEQS